MPTIYRAECREYGDDHQNHTFPTQEEAEAFVLDFHREHLEDFHAEKRADGTCESLDELNLWLIEKDIGYLEITKQTFVYLILLKESCDKGSTAMACIAYSRSEAAERVFEFFGDFVEEYIASDFFIDSTIIEAAKAGEPLYLCIDSFEKFLWHRCYGEFEIGRQPIYVDLLEGGE